MFIALIGDIVSSRVPKRGESSLHRSQFVRSELEALLAGFASEFSDAFAVSPALTGGDGFQCLIHAWAPDVCADLFWYATTQCELPIRFSFGVGEIHTRNDLRASDGINGPAFWKASAQMEILKHFQPVSAEGRFRFGGIDEDSNYLVNAVAYSAVDHYLSLTGPQKELVDILLVDPAKKNLQLSQLLGVKEAAVSNRKKRSNWQELHRQIEAWRLALLMAMELTVRRRLLGGASKKSDLELAAALNGRWQKLSRAS